MPEALAAAVPPVVATGGDQAQSGSPSVWKRARKALGRPSMGLPILLVVLAAALLIGSGIGQGPPTPAARAAALETQIRCPSCQDVSVAASTAPTAITVRHDIERWTASGMSDEQIENILVGRYGEDILLSPPGSGLTSVLWIIPVVLGVGALVVLGVYFWRRSRSMARLRDTGRS